MRKILLATATAFILSSFSGDCKNKEFEELYVLEGTWIMQGKKGWVFEEWKKENADLMIGRSYVIREGDTLVRERITLSKTDKGVFYTPTVAGQNNNQPVIFSLTVTSDQKFVFENPGHDFPKRIIYQIIRPDSLQVRIDDGDDLGKHQNFKFRRL